MPRVPTYQIQQGHAKTQVPLAPAADYGGSIIADATANLAKSFSDYTYGIAQHRDSIAVSEFKGKINKKSLDLIDKFEVDALNVESAEDLATFHQMVNENVTGFVSEFTNNAPEMLTRKGGERLNEFVSSNVVTLQADMNRVGRAAIGSAYKSYYANAIKSAVTDKDIDRLEELREGLASSEDIPTKTREDILTDIDKPLRGLKVDEITGDFVNAVMTGNMAGVADAIDRYVAMKEPGRAMTAFDYSERQKKIKEWEAEKEKREQIDEIRKDILDAVDAGNYEEANAKLDEIRSNATYSEYAGSRRDVKTIETKQDAIKVAAVVNRILSELNPNYPGEYESLTNKYVGEGDINMLFMFSNLTKQADTQRLNKATEESRRVSVSPGDVLEFTSNTSEILKNYNLSGTEYEEMLYSIAPVAMDSAVSDILADRSLSSPEKIAKAQTIFDEYEQVYGDYIGGDSKLRTQNRIDAEERRSAPGNKAKETLEVGRNALIRGLRGHVDINGDVDKNELSRLTGSIADDITAAGGDPVIAKLFRESSRASAEGTEYSEISQDGTDPAAAIRKAPDMIQREKDLGGWDAALIMTLDSHGRGLIKDRKLISVLTDYAMEKNPQYKGYISQLNDNYNTAKEALGNKVQGGFMSAKDEGVFFDKLELAREMALQFYRGCYLNGEGLTPESAGEVLLSFDKRKVELMKMSNKAELREHAFDTGGLNRSNIVESYAAVMMYPAVGDEAKDAEDRWLLEIADYHSGLRVKDVSAREEARKAKWKNKGELEYKKLFPDPFRAP